MAGKIIGVIASIGDQGDLVTDITAGQLLDVPRDESVTVCCDGHTTVGIFEGEHGQPESTFLAVIGDAGVLELQIIGMSAQAMLGIRVGESVEIRW